jgi:hypothetical protein
MNFDAFLKIHTACAKAWSNYEKRPGTFDVAFGDLKAAIAEVKKQPALAADPRCVAMFEWFEKVRAVVREKHRVRDAQQRRDERRALERYIKEHGDVRFFGGGDCSGNAR